MLFWRKFIVTKTQALGAVECNNAPQDTRNFRVIVEEQFPLQQGVTGWNGLNRGRRNSVKRLNSSSAGVDQSAPDAVTTILDKLRTPL